MIIFNLDGMSNHPGGNHIDFDFVEGGNYGKWHIVHRLDRKPIGERYNLALVGAEAFLIALANEGVNMADARIPRALQAALATLEERYHIDDTIPDINPR